MRKFIKLIIATILTLTHVSGIAQPGVHDLKFDSLAARWDEGIPLGNGTLGALIWQKQNHLRFSLDRADLWDERPMKGLHRKEFSYQWVHEQVVQKTNYEQVQKYFDEPYDNEPAPSKIPGAGLEFDTKAWGKVKSVHLSINNALCEVKWINGTILKTYVKATTPVGWFRFENVPLDFVPQIVPPLYQAPPTKGEVNSLVGDDLSKLGYKQGTVKRQENSITYEQQGWGGFEYEVNVRWKRTGNSVEGVWCISSQKADKKVNPLASVLTEQALQHTFKDDFSSHQSWWRKFWSKSAIHVPDSILEKQWYLEQYKFGSAARADAPPISLQAVWTADNGRIPPWKGDYHHDLNTQLSYWPSYSSNHLEEGMGYLNHLDANKANYKRYTKMYFNEPGLAVPGVTTLDGTEMGGWIQYSLSPTVSSWLGQHYYLQWRYSMDRQFLKNRAYPWIKDAATFLEHLTITGKDGKRQLPMSSSPEINDNSLSAWFPQNTNYDLSLMKFTFRAAAELATELGQNAEAAHWRKISAEFGDFALTANNELKFAPTMAYNQSHRHFSHAMSIYPLGLIKWEDGPMSQKIIKNTIHQLDSIGPAYWCGYSYAWLGSMKARAKDGAGAANALGIFAKAFCSVNSFHLNGDQTKSGLSKFTYRPFTLEGNFAFASGLQEMLLQSYAGFIEVFPAVTDSWKDISFKTLRAEGAFLVSAKKLGGQVDEVKIMSENGGSTKFKLPFKTFIVRSKKGVRVVSNKAGYLKLAFKTKGEITIKNGTRSTT
ncbi:glycoside hydrolase family 95 protein [Mucilaginibacter flavidus]|uniref:glycoside hydrolase family 95 protein n=1 Tax=Mucilaginibacter flavidus TaxID=2949309 RepID=UPI0020924338|nr:glycoside hydrolase family 95 protein [Mucilaginibacter flavidus]MCO5947539.1 glycoside hydrolase family 95 protein [Mucilaginibacter flavidus]